MMGRLNLGAARLMHKYSAHAATAIGGFGLLGHAMALARCQKSEVSTFFSTLVSFSGIYIMQNTMVKGGGMGWPAGKKK